jgi:homoserine O-acetyltransferase
VLNTSIFKHHAPFKLEAGGVLPEVELAYQALGQLNTDCSNVIWVCHAFTGSQDVADWWQGLVGKGKLFDPEQYFIICVNVLGSHYGSTDFRLIPKLASHIFTLSQLLRFVILSTLLIY